MRQVIYHNGTILTMEEKLYAQAVLVENGRILAVGDEEEVKAAAGAEAESVDLMGHTLLPAFIDPHSHFTACANQTMQVNLEGADSFLEIQQRIRAFIEQEKIPDGDWVNASGYDNNLLRERAHPDRSVLDEAAPGHPVVVQHQSGHMGTFNTMALKRLGVNADTPVPQGGVIAKKEGQPTGYMEEAAFVEYLKKVTLPSMEKFLEAYKKAQNEYASYGITTVQEGMMTPQLGDLYQLLIHSGILKLDVVAYVDINDSEALMERYRDHIGAYKDRIRIGGYKMFLDGSPQARTAWLREPYLAGERAEDADGEYRGYPTLTGRQVYDCMKKAEEERLQLLAHCNGDGACEQYLEAYRQVMEDMPDRQPGDIRPVMVHAQFLGRDQLKQVKRLGILPSFFLAHVYYWGDVHLKNTGEERASHISPAGSALKEGIRFTLHQDAPVIRPNMMETIWCAVNRITREGRVLGPSERITVLDALKAVTINGAYQYFEEDRKGSIVPGKLADFVILERNPLEVEPVELRNVRVLGTVKEGEWVYQVHEEHQ